MSQRFSSVNNSTDIAELASLADDAAVTLDVTELSLERLPLHVKATLFSRADTFNASYLRSCIDICAEGATVFDASRLETARHLDAYSATVLNVPELQAAGNIDARNVPVFSAPKLESSQTLDVRRATSVSVPVLSHVSGDVYTPSVTTFNAPKLREVTGDIAARDATIFNATELRHVSGHIDARSANVLNAPGLLCMGNLEAPKTTAFHPEAAPTTPGSSLLQWTQRGLHYRGTNI